MKTALRNRYGHFADAGAEYVIRTPETPRPWINYLTNGDYCALVSACGGGFSFYKDHRFHSVLRRGMHVHLEDVPARLWYIKDEATGEVWTANAHPIRAHDAFEARHGMGYTRIESRYRGVAASARYFVPPGVDAECWTLALVNRGRTPRRLSVYSFADFVLGNVSLDLNESQIMALFNEAEVRPRHILYHKRWWHGHEGWAEVEGEWPYRAFLTATVRPVRMLADRNAFFGPGRNAMNPVALEPALLPRSGGGGKDLAGVCQWRIELPTGGEWRVEQAIGVLPAHAGDGDDRLLCSLQQPRTYEQAWSRTLKHYPEMFATVRVQTPDRSINAMANWWNKAQLNINFYFGRGPSYYHKGQWPAMRDSCQDAFGMIPLSPKLARSNLLRIAGFFFRDGSACGGCNRIGLPEGGSIKVDLPLWFVLAVVDYLRETGEWEFLDESVPLMDGGASTILRKMLRGIARMLDLRGPHGLPLIGRGDWNDAANAIGAQGRGESVWLAQFLHLTLHEMLPVLEHRRLAAQARDYRRRAAQLRRAINEHGWDGEWFVRAFRDDGRPVGVRGQTEGFIWINSQTWAVISACSTPERLNRCMDSVERHLATPFGLTNLAPAFRAPDECIGLITRFRAGWKENAAVFSHASAFNVVARALLGRGRDAVELYRRILPAGKDPDRYLMEPYAFSQFCAGPAAGREHGRGAYHWLTGTAAWMFRAMTDYILGVRAQFDGLRIAPAVDPAWREFSITRVFRGAEYRIRFRNPDGVESGVREIWLDGRPVSGQKLPLPTARRHTVEVVMGG